MHSSFDITRQRAATRSDVDAALAGTPRRNSEISKSALVTLSEADASICLSLARHRASINLIVFFFLLASPFASPLASPFASPLFAFDDRINYIFRAYPSRENKEMQCRESLLARYFCVYLGCFVDNEIKSRRARSPQATGPKRR